MSTLHRDFRAESGDTAKWDREAAQHWVGWNAKPHGLTQLDVAVEDILAAERKCAEIGLTGLDFPALMRMGKAMREGQIK